ncbi:hypothetical protein Dsin_008043 [Dipteronia sinensis]|uniref:Uncharacterized protein n=1 Tax=Dipteronia sinensis TaxID=43782 RepID=A0AAE0B1T5_9ROSI|nr:hypothetical protein Dsin_008043 [Dipteronia sinensis]
MSYEVRGHGDEEQVDKSRTKRLGPRRHAAAARRPALIQLHSHGRDAGKCRWSQAHFPTVDELVAGPARLAVVHQIRAPLQRN